MSENKKTPYVSILVPCYNVEKYLDECLTSLVNQTLSNIEIICINDGSTDSTLDIIKSFAKQDKRIVVIDKQNEGYGKSMNRGLDAATGEYVAIVESDDWVEYNAFEKLYNVATQNDADMVKAEFVFFDNDTGKQSPSWTIGLSDKLTNIVINPTQVAPEIIWSGHPSIWTCIYRRKMINDKNIRFAETPGAAFQDMGFKPKTFIACERFVYIPDVILHYRKHANNSDKNNNKVYAVCDAHDDTDAWFAQHMPESKKLRQILNTSRFANYVWNLRRLYDEPKQEFKKRFHNEILPCLQSKAINPLYIDDRLLLKFYCIAYPRNIIWPILRTIVILMSPVYKTKIQDGCKVHYLFKKIPVYKQKI